MAGFPCMVHFFLFLNLSNLQGWQHVAVTPFNSLCVVDINIRAENISILQLSFHEIAGSSNWGQCL